MSTKNDIFKLYLRLLRKHGPPQKYWPQWCATKKSLKTREMIAIGAILTQRTSWHNVDLALKNLKRVNLLSLGKISKLKDLDYLSNLIKPAGFPKIKAKRLFTFCAFVTEKHRGLENFMKEDLETSRRELLSLNGIGPETADTILLYALEKPSFVIDEYTRRLLVKKGLSTNLKYRHLKDFFEKSLPPAMGLYRDFHALIIIEGKGEKSSFMKKTRG